MVETIVHPPPLGEAATLESEGPCPLLNEASTAAEGIAAALCGTPQDLLEVVTRLLPNISLLRCATKSPTFLWTPVYIASWALYSYVLQVISCCALSKAGQGLPVSSHAAD